ncbi:MAG: pyruvate synthase subunit beta [Candidatus Diapherotrites archaeon]|nr:pyruvate synthase subunit beta [Candidatus Diapherotrites archaeon]
MIAGLPEEEYFSSGHRACAGCGEILAVRHALKASGKNTIAVMATGCMEVVSTPYPESSWKVPWVHGAFENHPAIASGIDAALKALGKRDKINLLVFGGDGAYFDIGFQALSGALERGHKATYICTDDEAYMNTGVQRSGATPPFGATTTSPAGKKIHGKQQAKKPLPLIVAAHGIRYVATASVSNIQDYYKKVQKALATEGPSFIHVFTPCPTGWYYDSADTIEIARLAVECRFQPIYEIENGALKFTSKIENPKPVAEYLQKQGRFKHLGKEETEFVQKYVDERYNFLLELEKQKKAFDVLL